MRPAMGAINTKGAPATTGTPFDGLHRELVNVLADDPGGVE